MFLYEPKTDEQIQNLILVYQNIINNHAMGLIKLLFSFYHYRYYFIQKHKENKTWHRILVWADNFDLSQNWIDKILICTIAFFLFSYFGIIWISYIFKILVNYKKIIQEAPINLLELG